MSKELLKAQIQRTLRDDSEERMLFDIGQDWKKHWWGMPSFTNGDARPLRSVTFNFLTDQDFDDFKKKLGIDLSKKSNHAWWPHQDRLRGEFEYIGEKASTRYPVCIPSKGRYDCQKTGKALDVMGVDYKFFVEDIEYDLYVEHLGEHRVIKMPFNNLGQGSVPARNFIWEWAKENGHARHWVMDDNIRSFLRLNMNRRLCCRSGNLLRAIEDFTERYSNVAISGPHNKGFAPDRDPRQSPIMWNSRVYSCILIDTSLEERWRGKYNEDTDLCLRVLKSGKCTLLFRALLMDKADTVGAKGNALKGGNTDNVYNTGDHRLAFAQSLKDQHPDVTKVVWKFNRWHHQVDYSKFKRNKPIFREGLTLTVGDNEYGMELTRTEKNQDEPENQES